jgi:hypothetical protein
VLFFLPAEFGRETSQSKPNHERLFTPRKERIMTRFSKPTMVIMALIAFSVISVCALAQTPTHYVVTNDDQASGNTATIYQAGGSGGLTQVKVVSTGGTGLGGGYFATGRVGVQHDGRGQCFYVSNAVSGEITTIDANSLNKVGNFTAGSGIRATCTGSGWLWPASISMLHTLRPTPLQLSASVRAAR